MVLPFLSLYLTRDRGMEIAFAGKMMALYGVGALGGSWLGGWLSDRIGAIRAQKITLLGTGVALLGFLFVGPTWTIALAIFVLALVAEAFRPAAMTAVADRAPKDDQAKAFALLRLAANLGMAIGPAVGGRLAEVGYRWLFVADALTCLAAALVIFLFLTPRGRRREAPRPVPVPGSSPWQDLPFLLLMVASIGIAVLVFQVFTVLPIYLERTLGMPENRIGLLLGFNAAIIAVFEMVLVHSLRRRNPLNIVAVGALLFGGGLALMPLDRSLAFVAFTVTVWTTGEMLAFPMMNVVVAGRAKPSSRGSYMGMYTMSFSLAFIFAPALGAWIFDRFGPDVLWLGTGVLGVALCLWSLALRRHFRE